MRVEVRPSKVHGRGLFAARNFVSGELITKTPAVCVPRQELPRGNVLWEYTFGHDETNWLIGLGAVSFINHNEHPNAEIIYNTATQEIFLTATKPIREDDEIFIRYTEVWF